MVGRSQMKGASDIVAEAISAVTASDTSRPATCRLVDDLGLDSLAAYELLLELEDRVGLLSLSQFAQVRTVDDLIEMVQQRIEA